MTADEAFAAIPSWRTDPYPLPWALPGHDTEDQT